MHPDQRPSIVKAVKVLLVEDSFECAQLFEEYLKSAGTEKFAPVHVASLDTALKRLNDDDIEIILLDLDLPDSRGLDTLKKVHASFPHVPVIVLTGHKKEHMIAAAMREGAQDYLVKAEFAPALLIRSIQYAIERQRAVIELRESEERYRRIMETAAEGVWVIDAESKTTFVNQKMADLLGYTIEEMQGELLYAFMDDEARKIAMKSAERRRSGIREQYDFRFRRKNGAGLWTLVTTNPITAKTGRYTGALYMVTDISERTELELRYRQSQKMDAIGRLAGGVAHDFNNFLTAILGYCKLLEASMKPDDSRQQDLKEIVDNSKRAASLTGQLLAFSRRQVLAPKVLNLNSIVKAVEGMLKRLISEDIHLSVATDQELGNARADSGQIEQVIMNLVVNARDAMPKGGRISLETKSVHLGEDSPGRHDVIPAGNYAMIAVSDSGCGMGTDTQSHIFEPFFTTKEQGKGTGLGLSTVYGIVKQSGGFIWVYSEVGRGTTFKVYFPITMDPIERLKEETPTPKTLHGSETVLLAEDDTSVRHMLVRILKSSGYAVLEAGNGKEAIRIIEQKSKEIHLILTDIVMPELGGRGLADYVSLACPETKVIFMSGYTDDVIIRHGNFDPGTIFIQKPITSDVLLQNIRLALSTASKRLESKDTALRRAAPVRP